MAEKQKILIVDDDSSIAELVSLYLEKECYDTRICEDGEEALKSLEKEPVALIILDLMLRMFPSSCFPQRERPLIRCWA